MVSFSQNGGVSKVALAVANIRRPIVGGVQSIYKQTTVKPTSSSTSVQKVVNTTLGGQTTHATLPIKTQSTLATTLIGAKVAPQTIGLGGVQPTPGKNLMWIAVGFVVIVVAFFAFR